MDLIWFAGRPFWSLGWLCIPSMPGFSSSPPGGCCIVRDEIGYPRSAAGLINTVYHWRCNRWEDFWRSLNDPVDYDVSTVMHRLGVDSTLGLVPQLFKQGHSRRGAGRDCVSLPIPDEASLYNISLWSTLAPRRPKTGNERASRIQKITPRPANSLSGHTQTERPSGRRR